MAKASKKVIRIFELVWYSLCAAFVVWGIAYVILGLVGKYADVADILKADKSLVKSFGMGFFNWGLTLFAIGMGLAIIVLLVVAGTVDKTSEKAARRAARLAKIEADMAENAQ